MAFNPLSTIRLCNVPFDSSYKNVVYFDNETAQRTYFANKTVKTFTNYVTVRETLPDGTLQSAVKVEANIDALRYSGVNYICYQNAQSSSKYFYAFITKMIYVNEDTTKLIFETDVYQTWLFEAEIKDSYVVREHPKTDNYGEHIVPESFNFTQFEYTRINKTNLEEWGYLVGTTEQRGTDGSRGKMMSGIYQGLYFYFYKNGNNLNAFLDEIEEEGGDCVQFIAVIPSFNLKNNSIGATDTDIENGEGWVSYSDSPATEDIPIDMSGLAFTFDGYQPVNRKLYSYPFSCIMVSNRNGEEAEYPIEGFSNRNNIVFRMYGDVSANPTVTLIPRNYMGVTSNYEAGISLGGFPQCSFNSDSYKLWLAKNQYGMNQSIIMGGASLGMALATGGATAAASALAGVYQITSTMNNNYMASKEPNRGHSGCAKNNLLTSMGMNNFAFFFKHIKKNQAITIDNYFTMFGYQTNRLKMPNLSSRPCYNYVQTIDINIIGGIPNDDMSKLKAIYNSGVTLWKPSATIGDYSQDNTPD